jgi:hypothetical protein
MWGLGVMVYEMHTGITPFAVTGAVANATAALKSIFVKVCVYNNISS